MNIATEHLRFIGERTGAEGMLGVEGKCDVLHLIRGCEIPRCSLMTTMFPFHEIPSTISVSSQRPFSEISFDASTAIECRIGMAIVIRKVEKAIDATIKGDRKMLWYSLS